jgi:hypothetical protein
VCETEWTQIYQRASNENDRKYVEDKVKYLSERLFVTETSTAICMTIFDTLATANRCGAVGTSHQLQNRYFPSDCTASTD